MSQEGPSDETASEIEGHLPESAPVGPVLQSQAPEPSKSGLVRSGAIVMVFTGAGNALNVVFHFSVARFLPPDEYALLTTIFAVNVIATVPLIALQATVAREVSILLAENDDQGAGAVLRTAIRLTLRFAVVICILLAILAVPAIEILHIERPLPILATALSIITAVPLPAAWGALQASERFAMLSSIQTISPLLKLIIGVSAAAAGLGASAITGGVIIANIVAFLLARHSLEPMLRRAPAGLVLPARRVLGAYAFGSAVSLAIFTTLTQSDVIWARGALTPQGAGDYAAASVLANFVLLLPIGVTTVLFPRIARMGHSAAGRRPLLQGLAAVAGLSSVLLIAFATVPTLLLRLAFGPDYVGAADLVLPLGVAMLGYALVTVYVNHFLAQGRTRCAVVLGASFALQQGLFLAFHASPSDIVWVQIVAATVAVVGSELYDRLGRRLNMEPASLRA